MTLSALYQLVSDLAKRYFELWLNYVFNDFHRLFSFLSFLFFSFPFSLSLSRLFFFTSLGLFCLCVLFCALLNKIETEQGPKSVSVLNSKWIPLNKLQRRLTAIHEDNTINEILLCSIQDQINYHQASTVRLSKGLYLGYLKMQSSVDQIQIVVPAKTPNILPHYKIRDNCHISAEEWKFLKRNKVTSCFDVNENKPSGGQELFIDALTYAAHRLFKYMNIPMEDALTHRLYDFEVVELSAEVSFLVLCPRADASCAVPGHREILLQRGDLLSISIQAFEMIHLNTYQSGIIQKYSRLSCILELDTILANHSHREAFSTLEVRTAKERLAKLQDLTQSLNTIWKGVRWLMDVIGFARDRCTYLGLNMRDIFEYNPCGSGETIVESRTDAVNHQLLQPPARQSIKSSPGRGSWPGPSHSLGANGLLGAEHSKSEQQLSASSFNLSSRYLSATSGIENPSRKNSADSDNSHSGNSYYSAGESVKHINQQQQQQRQPQQQQQRIPPSRSEDTLILSKKHSTPLHRKRATTVNTNFTGDKTSSTITTTIATAQTESTQPNSQTTNESITNLSIDTITDADGNIPIIGMPVQTSTPNKILLQESNPNKKDDAKHCISLFPDDPNAFRDQLHIAESENAECLTQPLENYPLTNPFRKAASERIKTSSSQKNSPEHSKSKPKNNDGDSAAATTTENAANNMPGIIQVYAAYDTGLAKGTSLKLHVTPRTTAREVVDLVVKQLNMAIGLKGKDGPIYSDDEFDDFCLVAVIGARERCLRDDVKPLQLQNPWRKGRLYVRHKQNVLAALEHSQREAQLI